MSGLVDKVKEVVRNRSRSRKSHSMGDYDGRSSTDLARKSGDYTNRDSMNETRAARSRDPVDNMNSTTNDFAGMNLNDQQPSKTLPPLPQDAARNVQDASLQQREAELDRPQQGMGSSPTSVLHRKKFSRPENDYMDESNVPPRKSSGVVRKPVGGGATTDSTPLPVNGSSALASSNYDGAHSTNALDSNGISGHQHHRSRDTGSNDSAQLTSQQDGSSRHSGRHSRLTHTSVIRDHPHLRLPENFDLSHTEDTQVSTTYRPAVTHETVVIPVTEVRQKAINRDIHVDHYHHYIQPVTVREIHPAVHYSLNHETGERTIIDAPPGFQLPAHLQPTDPKWSDHSRLRKTERHYVVDEENPQGRLEDPPSGFRHDGEMIREQDEYTARQTQEYLRLPRNHHQGQQGLHQGQDLGHTQGLSQGLNQDTTLNRNQNEGLDQGLNRDSTLNRNQNQGMNEGMTQDSTLNQNQNQDRTQTRY